MELREYILIFRKNFGIFLWVLAIFLLVGIFSQFFRGNIYEANITLNVSRIGKQTTSDYRYDDFYRLQADERFSDTIVRWLESPRIVTDIYNEAGITSAGLSNEKLSKAFDASRLSSQIIEVEYSTNDFATAEAISDSLEKVINDKIENLNSDQKEETWFKVIEEEPVIREKDVKWSEIFLIFSALGIFFGVLASFIKHYLKEEHYY